MADETKRIIDQDNDQTLSAGDYVMVDSQAEGTRKFDLGTEISGIKEDLEELQNDAGVTAELKSALLQLAEKVAYIDDGGEDYYQDLYDALYPQAQSITCVYTQSGTVYTTDSLNSLKTDLVVTAHYSDSTTRTLSPNDYTLTGTLTAGTSTITVHYGNLTSTFAVNVTARTLSSISAVYTQSGTVYTDDDLDSLKSDLVVTATYNDSSTEIVPSTDYQLSGTLASGTSTITVSYGGKTTSFVVTVSSTPRNYTHVWDFTQSLDDTVGDSDATINNATRDSSGLHLSAANAVCFLGANVYPPGSVVEVDFASTSANLGTSHGRLMMINDIANPAIDSAAVSTGFIYRNTGAWSFYRGGWSADSSETNANVFSGKTLKMVYYQSDADNKFYTDVYVDNTLVASNGGHINEWNVYSSPLYIGSAGNSYHDAVITGVRIYPIEE